MPPIERFCLHGFDFLLRKVPKQGVAVYVRPTNDHEAERRQIGQRPTMKGANSFALGWAAMEMQLKKKGRPSQLKKPRTRVKVEEE